MQTILYPTIIRFPLERANGIQVVNTCHALAQLGCQVYLFVLKSSVQSTAECLKFYGLEPSDKLTIVRMPFVKAKSSFMWNGTAYASCLAHLYYHLLKIEDPVVLTRDFFLAQILLPWVRAGKCRLVYECHHIEHVFRKELYEMYAGASILSESKIQRIKNREQKVYTQISGMLTITQKLKEMVMEEFLTNVPVEVVHDGCRLFDEKYNECKQGHGKITKLLYVGDLNTVKGADVLLRAIKNIPDVHLTLAGGLSHDDAAGKLQALCDAMGLQDKISFLGFVPPCRVPELYHDADISLLPLSANKQNKYFTSPLKMFEYLAMGKAIIAADLPALREILTDEETALLVRPEDENAWAHAILRLSKDDVLRQTIAGNARALAAEYTWTKRAERIRQFIEGVERQSTFNG